VGYVVVFGSCGDLVDSLWVFHLRSVNVAE